MVESGRDAGAVEKPLVFVIDDEPDNLDLSRRSLAREFRVVGFENPKDAWTMAQQQKPELMIVDFLMPGLNGIELVRRIRAQDFSCAVLLVTAYAEHEGLRQAEREKLFFRIIPKPWRPADMLAQAKLAISTFRLHAATVRLGARLDHIESPPTLPPGPKDLNR